MISDFWDKVLNYSDYKKGGQYSASNLTNPPLITKLQEKYPELDDVATKDKVAAFIGSAIHVRCETGMNEAGHDEIFKTEVAMKFRSLSGTADLVDVEDGIYHIGDVKTGKEANIIKKIKDSTDWITQLSIYRYLAIKDLKIDVSQEAEIYWLCTDTGKYGIHSIYLLDTTETVKIIKEFYKAMKTPIEDEPMCDGCLYWRHRYCQVRSKCHHFGLRHDSESDVIDNW